MPSDSPFEKWESYSRLKFRSPFPHFSRPSPSECQLAHRILTELHGDRDPLSSNAMNAMEWDGLVSSLTFWTDLCMAFYAKLRTSRMPSEANSMEREYGDWTNYGVTVEKGNSKLHQVLQCGGLYVRKSKIIMAILGRLKATHNIYRLNHLLQTADEDAMQELLSYDGIGPKTASCVLALTLKRNKFVVDTHIHRITGSLGWRPREATAEQARAHLESKIPNEHKYALHLLFITHGRECPRCCAGGNSDHEC